MNASRIPFIVSVLTALRMTVPAVAQSSNAEDEFRALQVQAAPPAPSGGAVTDAQRDQERRQAIAGFVLAATKAREFYERHPAHAKAREARKIEVESLLRAVREGAVEHETLAVRLARDFRRDKQDPSPGRFQVAAFVRHLGIHKTNFGEAREEALAAYEKAARDLYGEFPDEPALYDLFPGVARNAPPPKAREIANQVLLMPAPAVAKDEASRRANRTSCI